MSNNEQQGRGESLPQQNNPHRPERLGRIQQSGEDHRTNKDWIDQGDSQRGSSSVSLLTRGEALGKILGQLRELREEYDSYTSAHKERLEARLRENRERREEFFVKADKLEEEVMLMLQQEAGESELKANEEE
jgi:hypothetical protein